MINLTFLFPVFDTVKFVHARSVIGGVTSERDLQGGQESVHTRKE